MHIQVVVVFIGSLLAGSLFSQAVQLLQNPSSVVRVIGTSAPETASFFCSYLLLQATLTKPIAFLRLGGGFPFSSMYAYVYKNSWRQAASSVVRVIGISVPETAASFCSYLLLQATLTKPIGFLRLGGRSSQAQVSRG